MPSILHVDMDAFYASIEQRDHPSLRGTPVVVGGSPDSRGVVSAASYEARKWGVHSAMPSAEAARLCPKAVFVTPNFAKYTAESRQIMSILRSYTSLVEPLSLDEAFLDVTASERAFGKPFEIAQSIKIRIRKETGLVASVGIAPNKFLAKLGSDLKKPDGLVEILPEQVDEILRPLPVEKIFGVGRKLLPKFQKMRIRTIGDLADASEERLTVEFGTFGRRIFELAHGRDPRPVVPEREEKSKGMERTFEQDTADLEFLRKRLLEFSEELGFELRSKGLRGRTIAVKVRFSDFRTITRSRTLELPTNLGPRIYTVSRELLDKVTLDRPVRLLGVSLSRLEDLSGPIQKELFDAVPSTEEKESRRARSVDQIWRKYGKKAIYPASGLGPLRKDAARKLEFKT